MLQRYYELASTDSGFTVDSCLTYNQDEVGSLGETQFRLCRWTGSEWSCPASSTDDNLVRADDITEMSTWAISEGEPMAITLARFTARPAVEIRFLATLALVALGAVGGLVLWARRMKHKLDKITNIV